MSPARQTVSGLADPTTLEPYHAKSKDSTSGTGKPGEDLLQVVIETPRGSRNKYSFDPEQRVFRLKSALPSGMVFPFDFGFVPSTLGGDGDPLDVLVLMDEPAFPGCVLLVEAGAFQVFRADGDHFEVAAVLNDGNEFGNVAADVWNGDAGDLRCNDGALGGVVVDEYETVGTET